MKKYLLPLILILLLAFTLAGFGADLFGTYDQRIKLTIDNTKIDATLTWFPVTVLLTATAGEEVFVELDEDTDFDKVAFTKADESTQLYADCELYDVSEEKAIYHVSLDGWEIASGADTDFYMYYDDDASNNSSYIGLSGGGSQYPPAQSDTYVKSTTKANTSHWAYFATDPAKSLTGTSINNSWTSGIGSATNQRFHIDLGSAEIINKIYYENQHNSGSNTDMGVQNFTFQGSNTGAGTFDDLVYANDGGWTQLTISQSTFDEHIDSDTADPKYITVTNTTAYRYYAFKFADNYGDATYMGVRRVELQTSTVAQSVWDANFKAVYHMYDETTSTILDSTSNNNDGTKKGANEPVEATGKVGQGQDFDGSDDYIIRASGSGFNTETGTWECIVQKNVVEDNVMFMHWYVNAENRCKLFTNNVDTDILFAFNLRKADNWDIIHYTSTEYLAQDTPYHVAVVQDGSNLKIKVDGVDQGIAGTDAGDWTADLGDGQLTLGAYYNGSVYSNVADAIMDEVRISNTNRSNAWIKATYNSLWDTLLTYGSEETPTGITWNGITITKWNGITITKINGK